jgi:hypothetical protein
MHPVLVETTSDILLVDPHSGDLIENNRPSVVAWTSFVEARIGVGQIRLIAGRLIETATDEEFLKYFAECEGNLDLAVESFLSEFELVEAVGEKSETTATTKPEPQGKAPVKA